MARGIEKKEKINKKVKNPQEITRQCGALMLWKKSHESHNKPREKHYPTHDQISPPRVRPRSTLELPQQKVKSTRRLQTVAPTTSLHPRPKPVS